MKRIAMPMLAAGAAALALPAASAEPVMVQCGREYQAARSAGTLNGMDWAAYRTACAERLKAGAAPPPPAAGAPAPMAATPMAATPMAATPVGAAPAGAAAAPAVSGGMAAMHARQKQCGAEWRAQKAALLARTPGLTWPKYWSQCNTRLKAAGG